MSTFKLNFEEVGKEISLLNQGTVLKIHIDAGLTMRIWNLSFSQAITLSKLPEPMHSQFHLLFILTPDTIGLESVDEHVQYNNNRERHALLIPDNVSVQFKVKAHQPVQIIEFTPSVWWLKDLLSGLKSKDSFAQLWGDPDYKTVYIEPGSWQMNMQAGELFKQTNEDCAEPEKLMPSVIGLITAIMEKTFSSRTKESSPIRDIYHGKMEEAEKILMGHLQDKLPNLSQIARQLAISESTLKRHFKIVFGKSIYGYYLARKMEEARRLMDETNYTVNEMAEILGYEKVSYFIEIFRKYHGMNPGQLNRRRKSA